MVVNIARNQKQINFAAVFSTIIYVFMVLLITSLALFVDHMKVASKPKQPLVNGQTFSLGRRNYLFSLKAAVSGGGCQTAAMLPLGWTGWNGLYEPGAALQIMQESHD